MAEEQQAQGVQTVTEIPLQLAPHRGVVILILGLIGLLCCFICGIIAWVMGNNDLREMAAGRMDPSGEGLTKAGKICGMIGVIWNIVVLVGWLLIVILGSIFAASGSSTTVRFQ